MKPLQILYLNVLTDVFPALALGIGPENGSEMKQPPRSSGESLLSKTHWAEITGWAFLIALCVLSNLQLAIHWLSLTETGAVTVSFLTLAFAKLWFPFNLRSPHSHFLINEISRNPWVWASIAFCISLLVFTVYVPWLSSLLSTERLGMSGWGLLLAMSSVPLLLGQIYRSFRSRQR